MEPSCECSSKSITLDLALLLSSHSLQLTSKRAHNQKPGNRNESETQPIRVQRPLNRTISFKYLPMSSPRGPRAVPHGGPLTLRHHGHHRQNALALPKANAYRHIFTQPSKKTRWFQVVGQGRWRLKGAAATSALVVDHDSPQTLSSHARGGATFLAKHARNELADVVASSQDDELFYYGGLDLGNHDCGRHARNRHRFTSCPGG